MKTFRRHLYCLGTAVAIGASSIASVHAGSATALRLIVPCAVGTPADLLARGMASAIVEGRGQQVRVENIPGDAERAAAPAGDGGPADGRSVIFSLGSCGDEESTRLVLTPAQ
jgi:tripartite-type tricarboxylate transporter receptor subunit TctC